VWKVNIWTYRRFGYPSSHSEWDELGNSRVLIPNSVGF